jgi:hypothetical protein
VGRAAKVGSEPEIPDAAIAPMTVLRLAQPVKVLGQLQFFLLLDIVDTRWPDQEEVE